MSENLGISVSYLNLIERDQRPVTAQLLVRLAESYDVDPKTFAGTDEARALAGLKEVFADPLLKGHKIDAQEIKSVAQASPETSQAILALYHAYREAVAKAAELAERVADQDRLAPANAIRFPAEEVRDFLHSRNNHYAELETAAKELHERAKLVPEELFSGLKAHLAQKLGIGCTILPIDVLPNTLRWYDRHRRRVLLSEMLNESGRVFQLAYQIGLLEHGETIERIVADAKLSTPEAQRLSRVTLANYFAGATMMPYPRFLSAAETTRYDIDVLCQRFGAGFEQVCHRLTTLRRREARGVPFFMIRVDTAGNVSKRFQRRQLPVRAPRRRVPALERAHCLPDAGPHRDATHPDAGWRALFLDRAHRRAFGPRALGARSAFRGRARVRDRLRQAHRLCRRPRHRERRRRHPDRHQLPAVRAHRLQPARLPAPEPPPGGRRIPARDLAVLLRCRDVGGGARAGAADRLYCRS